MSATAFFKNQVYAVLGASADPSKFGNKVLCWYLERQLNAIPINLKADSIESVKCIKSIADLADPGSTSVSVITPPAVTLSVLNQAYDLGIRHLWLQPGCESQEVYALIKEWRESNNEINVLLGGPCILVEGDAALAAASNKL
ncbi:NAD(P)-binding protein [Chytriomyces sp. MP71]|nr:NAD(P)-binding protein [Chytriomyces sp. MP71]